MLAKDINKMLDGVRRELRLSSKYEGYGLLFLSLGFQNILDNLPTRTSRDKKVIRVIDMRFGLDGEGRRSLEEVGKEFGVTRERIRQLEKIGLRRIEKEIYKSFEGKRTKDCLS